MDNEKYTTDGKRCKGKHLTDVDRGVIKALNAKGYSARAIARELNCSPSTITKELKQGTPPRKGNRGRKPGYSPERSRACYEEHRKNSRKQPKVFQCVAFVAWVIYMVRVEHWSLDACVGRARKEGMFRDENGDHTVCTKTLYNAVWKGRIELTPTELPVALKRKQSRRKSEKKRTRNYGKSIDDRPEIADARTEFGHWEGDTVVGTRDGKGKVVFSLLEKSTGQYLALLIPSKTAESVMAAMVWLRDYFGKEYFSEVFKTITVDNGPEFSDLSQIESWRTGDTAGTEIYFAHPYKSTDRAQNENANGRFRAFAPKGVSMEGLTQDDVQEAADLINELPRRSKGYQTAQELFDAVLDRIYSTGNCYESGPGPASTPVGQTRAGETPALAAG